MPKAHPELVHIQLSAITSALAEGLSTSLLELAGFHGGRPGQWIDELERRVVRRVQDFPDTCAPPTAEAAASQAAVLAIRSVFTEVRRELAQGGGGSHRPLPTSTATSVGSR